MKSKKQKIKRRYLTKNEKSGDDEYDERRLDDDTDEDPAGVVERFREVEQPWFENRS